MGKYLNLRANIALGLVFAFLVNTLGPMPVYAQDFVLPNPGVRVSLSPVFNPPILKGIKVHSDNPFRFDFILDRGNSQLSNAALKEESSKLIKYFLASLTIPEKDLWVNLSPYEKDRIIPNSFGLTEMGRDLLAEDYMLKQITASVIYPEGETGKKFWKRIYEEAAERFGTTNIPVNTFNKVWIVPEKAVVYENAKAGTAFVVESKLKVMLEQDYLALSHSVIPAKVGIQNKIDVNALGSQIVREIVIPELTKEVNEGRNFFQLRQVYNSLILATWYKKKIKDSILEQVYANKNKVAGVSIDDPREKERIYQRYLQAFKKGAYNYIKEEIDPATQEMMPRKYFSGGIDWAMTGRINFTDRLPQGIDSPKDLVLISGRVDAAMVHIPQQTAEEKILSDFVRKGGDYLWDTVEDETLWRRGVDGSPSEGETRFSTVLRYIKNRPTAEREKVYFQLFNQFFTDEYLPRLYVLHREIWKNSREMGLHVIRESIEHLFLNGQWDRRNAWESVKVDKAYAHILLDTLYLLAQMDIAEAQLRSEGSSLKQWFEEIILKSKEDPQYEKLRQEVSAFIFRLLIFQPFYVQEYFNSDIIHQAVLEDREKVVGKDTRFASSWVERTIRDWGREPSAGPDGRPPGLFMARIRKFLLSDGYRVLREMMQPRLAGAVNDHAPLNQGILKASRKFFNEEKVDNVFKLGAGDIVDVQVDGQQQPILAVVADESRQSGQYFLLDFNLVDDSYIKITSAGMRLHKYKEEGRAILSIKRLHLRPEMKDDIKASRSVGEIMIDQAMAEGKVTDAAMKEDQAMGSSNAEIKIKIVKIGQAFMKLGTSNQILSYEGKTLRAVVLKGEAEDDEILGTTGALSCAPMVVYETKGGQRKIYILHYWIRGRLENPDNSDLDSEKAAFFSRARGIDLKNSTVIIPYDIRYRSQYEAIATAVGLQYPSSVVFPTDLYIWIF